MKLDYSLEDPNQRLQLVNQILQENPNPTEQYLEILADYLLRAVEKKERKILTENRLATVNKRETSLEGITAKLEAGEDGLYNLINEEQNFLFVPKISITKADLEQIAPLAQLRQAIEDWERLQKKATGRDAYIIKRALIEMRKDQYIIKNAYRKPIALKNLMQPNGPKVVSLPDTSYLDENNELRISGISLMNPSIVSNILKNYSRLKQDSSENFVNDTWYLMQDFDALALSALSAQPVYLDILILKIDGLSNADIQQQIQEKYGIKYSLEYLSSLWCNKIPKLIAQQAQLDFVTFDYRRNNKPMKKCSKCGQEKPAHPLFFSKNNTSKDKLYSICKVCRNAKTKEKK